MCPVYEMLLSLAVLLVWRESGLLCSHVLMLRKWGLWPAHDGLGHVLHSADVDILMHARAPEDAVGGGERHLDRMSKYCCYVYVVLWVAWKLNVLRELEMSM
jgi:hypothetical protein